MKAVQVFLYTAFIILYLGFLSLAIYHTHSRIMAYDMKFYTGKDNGYFARIESILLFSTILFLMLGHRHWLLNGVIGLGAGLMASIIAYFLVAFLYIKDNGLVFHITACLIFIVLFLVSEKSMRRIRQAYKNSNQ